MLTARDILLSALLPGLVSLVLMLLAWRPWRSSREAAASSMHSAEVGEAAIAEMATMPARRGPVWMTVLALAAAFLVAFPNILGRVPAFPPHEFTAGLFYIGIGVAVIGLILSLLRLPWPAGAGVALLVGATAAGAAFLRQLRGGWPAGESATAVAGVAIASVIWWLALERPAAAARAEGRGGAFATLLMLLIGAASAVTLALLNNLAFGRLAGAMTAGVGGVLIVALWRRDLAPLAGAGAVLLFAVIELLLIAGAHFLSDLSTRDALLLAAAPIGIWIGLLVPARRYRWPRGVVQVLLVLIPFALAIALSMTRSPASPDQPDLSNLYGFWSFELRF